MLRWQVSPSPEAAAVEAAHLIAEALRQAVRDRGAFDLALSGGSNTRLLDALGAEDLDWTLGRVHQVDERIAPAGDAARNLVGLRAALPDAAKVHAMPVEDADLEAAAARYAAGLPGVIDVIQLGVGDDGHTASMVPDDPVLGVDDRDVALTQLYRGHRRMTLTYPVLDRAGLVVWVATGPAKRGPLQQLADRDLGIPATHVQAAAQIVVCDEAAAPELLW
jgi:6-phosphogluconolactonase